jgi:UDP-glucose 4-epimerase
VIFGDGSQTRDFTFVANVVAANLAASEREGVAGRTFNVATGRAVSLLELTRLMAGILHSPIQPVFEPTRAGDVPHSLADISAAKEGLGYEPQVGLREGLERTVRFMAGADVRLRRTAA